MSQGYRTRYVEFLANFGGKPANRPVVKVFRDRCVFMVSSTRNLLLLALDITVVFGRDFYLLRHLRVGHPRPRAGQGDQRTVADLGSPQQLHQ